MNAGGSPAPRSPARSTRSAPTKPRASSRWSRARARRTPARSTTSPASPTCARHEGCGSTSTGHTGAPGSRRRRCASAYRGIERADSFIVDPHKWLFAPYDCCALVYRDPSSAYGVFRQEAGYLDTVNQPDAAWSEWNPADYAYHLSRRARGLPLWFSLATYGTDAYREAIERVLTLTRETAEEVRGRDELELVMDPELSVVLFRRLRVERRRLRGVVAPAARGPDRVRATDHVAGREARTPVLREPAHDDRPRARGARHDDVLVPDRALAAVDLVLHRHQARHPLLGRRVGREQARQAATLQRRRGFTMNMCASPGCRERGGGTRRLVCSSFCSALASA